MSLPKIYTDIRDNASGHFQLNDTTGTIAINAIGPTGTYINMDLTNPLKIANRCLEFDGVDGQIIMPSYELFSTVNDISLSIWFKYDSYPGNDSYIFSSRGTSSSDRITIGYENASNHLCVRLDRVGSDFHVSTGNATGNVGTGWHHIGLSWDSVNGSFYAALDGVELLGTQVFSGGSSGFKARVGCDSGGVSDFFNGKIKGLRVFSEVLTPYQLSLLANPLHTSTYLLDSPNLTACFPFEESVTGLHYDISSNADHAIPGGGVSLSTDAEFSFNLDNGFSRGGVFTKTAADGWTNNHIEFGISNRIGLSFIQSDSVTFGLDSTKDPGNYTLYDYAWRLFNSTTAHVYVDGSVPHSESVVPGDLLEIISDGTQVTFLKNSIIVYTATTTPSATLYASSLAYNQNRSWGPILINGSPAVPVVLDGITQEIHNYPKTVSTSLDVQGNSLTYPTPRVTSGLNNNTSTAIRFDGIDDYVECGDYPMGTGHRSIALWMQTIQTGEYNGLAGVHQYAGTDGRHGLYLHNSKIGSMFTASGTNVILTSSTNVDDGQPHHIAITYDRNGMCKLYIDTVLEDQDDISSYSNFDMTATGLSFDLGQYHDGAGNADRFFSGILDDVIISNNILSEKEIGILYNFHPGACMIDSSGSTSGTQTIGSAFYSAGDNTPEEKELDVVSIPITTLIDKYQDRFLR